MLQGLPSARPPAPAQHGRDQQLRRCHIQGARRIQSSWRPKRSNDEERGDFWHYNIAVDFRVSIPKGSAIKIRTYVGNIEVAALSGAVDVSTNDGSITLRNLEGSVRASAIGDITCHLSGAANGGNVALSVYGGTAHLIVPSGEQLNTSTGVRATARAEALELIRASGAASERLTGVLERTKRQVTVEVSRGVALLHAR